MYSSLTSLAGNLTDGFHQDKCKNCNYDLEYMAVSNVSSIFKLINCKENYVKEFDKDLRFGNT